MKEKILLIQLKQIGDVLMTTPSIRALSRFKPEAELHFLTQKPANQVLEYNPYLSKILLFPPKSDAKTALRLTKYLRKQKYSTVIDFMGTPKTAIISWICGAKERIGFNLRGRKYLYNQVVATAAGNYYSASQKMFLLEPLAIPLQEDVSLDLPLADKDRLQAKNILKKLRQGKKGPLISVSPVSRRDYKVWPAIKFAKVCDFLVEKYNALILFIWGPDEYHFIQAVRDEMRHESLGDYGLLTLRETAAIMELADLHIGNDNGPRHFAIARQTPTLAVFGRPWASNWTPAEDDRHQVVEKDPGCKSSCVYPKCKLECIMKVPLKDVLEKVTVQMNNILVSSKSGCKNH